MNALQSPAIEIILSDKINTPNNSEANNNSPMSQLKFKHTRTTFFQWNGNSFIFAVEVLMMQ